MDGILGLPEGVTLRIIDLDSDGADPEDTKPLEGDDAIAAGGIERAYISTYEE